MTTPDTSATVLHSPGQRTPGASASSRGATGRNQALDFTKGALVLCMVVYHFCNYFWHDRNILRYLHFLTPSFIFITGFLVSNVYLSKYGAKNVQMYKRLSLRGAKLVGLFIVLNLLVFSRLAGDSARGQLGISFLSDHFDSIFIFGDQKIAAFEVLLPIGYLLLLSGALLPATRLSRYFLPGCTALILATALGLSLWSDLPPTLELIAMGLLGMSTGLISLEKIDRWAQRLAVVAVAYLAYVVMITFYYPDFAVNILGVSLTLMLFYSLGTKAGSTGFVASRVIALGRYSLFAYIAQIGLLQALHSIFRRLGGETVALPVVLVVACILVSAVIEAVDWMRRRSGLVDQTYKWIFA